LISRRWFIVGILVLSVVALFFSSTEFASAHANQIDSSPAPNTELESSPERVIIWFSEPIEDNFSVISVLDSAANQVDLGDSALDPSEPTAMSVGLPSLENGTYTVVWKNLSAVDGHKVIGSFVFAVGEPISAGAQLEVAEQPLLQSAADPWMRWIVFLMATLIIGGLIFELLVSVPVMYSESSRDSLYAAGAVASIRWRTLSWYAFAILLFALLGQLIQQASVLNEVPAFQVDTEMISGVISDSSWGQYWSYRLIAVLILAVFLFARQKLFSTDEDEITGDSVISQLSAVVGLVFLALISISSHNAASPVEIKTFATATDFIHLASATIWLGGIAYLGHSVRVMKSELGHDDFVQVLKQMIARFTPIALIGGFVLVATGSFATYLQVTEPVAMRTPYGWVLALKLVFIVPLIVLAGINGFRLAKKLGVGGQSRFGRSVLLEAGVGITILLTVAWLASLEPARQYAGRTGLGVEDEVTFSDTADGTTFDVTITPGQVGQNDVRVELSDVAGREISNAVDVRVRLKFLDDDLGEPLVSLDDQGAGEWILNDATLNIAGGYQAEIVVQRPDAFDGRTAFRFDAQSSATATSTIEPDTDTANTMFGIQLLLIGGFVVLVGFRGLLPCLFGRVNRQPVMIVPGVAVGVIGILLIANVQFFRLGLEENLRNPFPPTSESVSIGAPVYIENCATCHGTSGLGDGPGGQQGLPKPPADLFVHVPLHSDTILFEFIRDGITESGMPGQDGVLSDDDMWHLVNYLRAEFER